MSVRQAWLYAVLAGLWLSVSSSSLASPEIGDPSEPAPVTSLGTIGIAAENLPADVFREPLLFGAVAPSTAWPARPYAPASWPTDKARPSQPFGYQASTILKGGLQAKWQAVKSHLAAERRVLANCRADIGNCPSAAKLLLSLIDRAMLHDGKKMRIAEINRAINLTIRFVSDAEQYGVEEFWSTPLNTFAQRAGDCEDYAIAKYVALQEMGFSNQNLRLVVIRDENGEGHAVAAVRFEEQWLMLDNRQLAIQTDMQTANATPLFVIDDDGAKRLVAADVKPRQPEPAQAAALLVSVPALPFSPALL